MLRSDAGVRLALATALAFCSTVPALSHGIVGNRFFPATITTDDPFAADELSLPTVSYQNTGIDPTKPKQTASAPPPATTPTGTTPGAGARGAARGAIVGGMVGDAGAGAAAGAAAGRAQSRRQNAAQQQQATQQAQASQGAEQATYAKARAACLEGRGYTVK